MQRLRPALFLVLSLIVAACSAKVTPVQTPTGTINPAENSLTETRSGIAVTVKLDELSVSPYQMVDNITSFHVVIANQTDTPFEVSWNAFMLRDGQKRQYRSIKPEQVREIVSKDTVYLIPYPYVGYYYLEDHEKVSHFNTFSSSLPFYAEYHPQDIFTRALPEGSVLPGSKVAGVVYFIADLESTDKAELLYFVQPEAQGEPVYTFPFAIE